VVNQADQDSKRKKRGGGQQTERYINGKGTKRTRSGKRGGYERGLDSKAVGETIEAVGTSEGIQTKHYDGAVTVAKTLGVLPQNVDRAGL